MKRLLLALVVAFLASAPVARADEPTRVPITVLPFFTSACGYFLGVDVVAENRVVTCTATVGKPTPASWSSG